jgi:uncharacterized membrane protein YdbT with pleckstrin-like domain
MSDTSSSSDIVRVTTSGGRTSKFEGANPLEHPVVLHPSLMFIVKRLIIWGICIVVGGVLWALWGSDLGGVPRWMGVALIVIPALWVGAAEVRRRCTTLTLDVRGIHLAHGILVRRTATIPLPRIATVDVDQGLLSRMLHIGDLTIHSNDSGADEVFPKAHEPVKLANLISDMIQQHGSGLNQSLT